MSKWIRCVRLVSVRAAHAAAYLPIQAVGRAHRASRGWADHPSAAIIACVLAVCVIAIAPAAARAADVQGGSLVFSVEGAHAGDVLGGVAVIQGATRSRAVAGVGDLDGDGFGEIIAGAPRFDGASGVKVDSGIAYVYSGRTRALLFTIEGENAGDGFGASVAGIGDFNGDGTPDFGVGAPYYHGAAGVGSGKVYVYSGVDAATLRTLEGNGAQTRFGAQIGAAGRFSAASAHDVIVSEPYNGFGKAFVFSFASGSLPVAGFSGPPDLSFATDVACAGDFNGDGRDDVIVGAPNEQQVGPLDRVYIYSGADASLLLEIPGETSDGYFGASVATAYDYDDDGRSEVVVGAPLANASGRVHVFSSAGGTTPIATFDGENPFDYFGSAVAGLRDFNGDGRNDIAVSALQYPFTSGNHTGKVYVYSGSNNSLLFAADGEAGDDRFGRSLHPAGDVNGDSLSELIVGANGFDGVAGSNSGKVYVYSGASAATPTPTLSHTVPATPTRSSTATAMLTATRTETVTPLATPTGSSFDEFNAQAEGDILALAVQADGKILVGGNLRRLGDQVRRGLGRLHADGSLDVEFNPGADNGVTDLAVQPDGKIVVGGFFTTLAGRARAIIGRLHPDGTLDTSFVPRIEGAIFALALQSDGKIIVTGSFQMVDGEVRRNLARLNSDGTLDRSFNAGSVGDEFGELVALQPDGKILVNGFFETPSGMPRVGVGRLHPDGAVDTTFTPHLDSAFGATVQADEKILTRASQGLGRLNSNGSLDATFHSPALGSFVSTVLQTNGKPIAGGALDPLQGFGMYLVRVEANGTVDTSFVTISNRDPSGGGISEVMLQGDGKVLVGGKFTMLDGQPKNGLVRFLNADAATEDLRVDSRQSITWLRGGSSPEVLRVTFEFSTNGTSFSPLGAGSRIADGWRLDGLSLPAGRNIVVRARGYYLGSVVESRRSTVIPGPTPLAGDANCDRKLTAADLSALQAAIAAGGEIPCGADGDASGRLDQLDVSWLIRHLFGDLR